MKDTFYQAALNKGFTRRQFLQFCGTMSVMLGLELSATGKIARALETKTRIPVIYLNLQECTCCTESLVRTAHPMIADIVLNLVSLDYHETLFAAAGHQAEAARYQTMEKYKGNYLVVVEGSVPVNDGGIYCTIGGKTSQQILEETAKDSLAVIAFGSCATNGCVQAARPNPTGAKAIKEIIKNKPVIDVPGCPPIGEVISAIIAHFLTFERLPELNNMGRPKAFYNHRLHDNCNRRAFFDAGMFVENFDDRGAKHGWCLYKMGCKGPTTYNACAITQWNNGVSWPVKSGHPCLGCSEPNWCDNGTFYTRTSRMPGSFVPFDADKVGLAITGAAVAGIGVHAAATALSKAKPNKNDDSEE